LRRDTEKMGAALPLHIVLADQPQISLIYQGRALQGVLFPLVTQLAAGDPVQLPVDQRDQFLQSLSVAGTPALEKMGNAMRVGFDFNLPIPSQYIPGEKDLTAGPSRPTVARLLLGAITMYGSTWEGRLDADRFRQRIRAK
jgi:hypothetical protein